MLILHFFPKNLTKCLLVLKKITWKVKQVCCALLSNNCFSETLFNARTFSYDNVGITTKVIWGRKLGLIDHIFRKPNTKSLSGAEPKGRDESVVFHEQMNKNREQRGKRRRLRLEAAEVKTIDEHSQLYFDDYLHRNIIKLRSEQKT